MIRLVLVAAAVLVSAQEKPKPPSYHVVITAKTGFMAPKKAGELAARLKAIAVYAKQTSRAPVPEDTSGLELWSFEIAGDSKFDLSILQRAFADIQCRKWVLSFTGTATQDPQSKIIFVTSFGGKVKAKLMNRPKKDSTPDQEVADEVGKVSKKIADGKLHFTVSGEIFSHGGTLALLLESFSEAAPPPEEPKK